MIANSNAAMLPKISIITVAYNSERFVRACISSVQQQTYPNIEYIFIDGASADGTVNIVKELMSNGAIKLMSEPDNGIYDAINKGIAHATGEWIGILNSDDFYPDKNAIKHVVDEMIWYPDVNFVCGGVDFVERDDVTKVRRVYRSTFFRKWMLRFGLMPPHPGIFIRSSFLERVGFYKTDYKIAGDFEFVVRCFTDAAVVPLFIPNNLVRMRLGGVSTAGWRSNWRATREMLTALRANHIFSTIPILLLRFPAKILQFRI